MGFKKKDKKDGEGFILMKLTSTEEQVIKEARKRKEKNFHDRVNNIVWEEGYKEGFKDGLSTFKPNKKLAKAIKKGVEV